MRCFWDERQRAHAPAEEFFNGELHPAAEHQGRVDAILAAIGPTRSARRPAASSRCCASTAATISTSCGRPIASGARRAATGDAFPYTFPVVGRRPLDLNRIDALLGQYSFDTSTPIGEGTWDAGYWARRRRSPRSMRCSAASARPSLSAARPGIMPARDYLGGYSYLNNAAICAEAALAAGGSASRSSTSTITTATARRTFSPAATTWSSPRSTPIPRPTIPSSGAMPTRARATSSTCRCRAARTGAATRPRWPRRSTGSRRGAPELLIVCYGADTYDADPISHFKLKTSDYAPMARRIAALGLPTLIVMEGGYAVDALGANVAEFLGGFE